MKFLLFLALILVSAHYSKQDTEAEQSVELSDSIEEKPVQLPARAAGDEEEVAARSVQEDEAIEKEGTPVQLPARDLEISDELTKRSVQDGEVLEEGTPVQLPARNLQEEIPKRSKKGQKCKKCGKNAECVKGKCRCKKGFRRWRGRCIRGRKCSKKCAKNARCFRGKCRCRRGYRWNREKKQCVRKITKRIIQWLKIGRATACEGQGLTLQCGRGRVIRVVHSLYGRTNRRTCAENRPIKTTKCRAKNSKKIAVKSCDGKRLCRLSANNGVYGDPCKGTFKYLTVIYGCRKPCVKNAYFNGRVCECKRGYKGRGYRRCTKRKTGRDLEEAEKRDVSDDDMDINENGLEMA